MLQFLYNNHAPVFYEQFMTQVSKMLILAACFGSASAREATYYIIFSNPPILSKQNLCSDYLLSMSLYGSLLWPMNDVWIIVID